jgi:hypothetical protein
MISTPLKEQPMHRFLPLLATLLAVFTATAAAHHSIAMFDNVNPTTLN